jgi:tRNA C32,U32 (ribose-2'-O)-methylase TrmJ|tara:strand:+ start:6935 stop:7207 length:273 start_codon:yes stop_codon:yes gene_type:complete
MSKEKCCIDDIRPKLELHLKEALEQYEERKKHQHEKLICYKLIEEFEDLLSFLKKNTPEAVVTIQEVLGRINCLKEEIKQLENNNKIQDK